LVAQRHLVSGCGVFDALSSVVCWAGEGCTVEVFVGDGFFDGLPP
jgi:hypothetical protein